MRAGFDELVEGYIELFIQSEVYPIDSTDVLDEIEATYELTQDEINYVKMKCKYL